MSERHACWLLGLGRSTHRHRAGKDSDAALRMKLKELAARRTRFGYRRLTAMLLREGMPANHKRVYRLHREEGLTMRIRQRRRPRWSGAVVKPVASQPNERWSMDFVSDCVSSGKVIRTLIEIDTSLGGLRVRPSSLGCILTPRAWELHRPGVHSIFLRFTRNAFDRLSILAVFQSHTGFYCVP